MNKGIIEGLLFVTGEDGLSLEEIANLLELTVDETRVLLKELEEDLKDGNRGLKLVYLCNKYKISTKE